MAEYARVNGVRPAERKFNVHRRSISRWMAFRLDEIETGEHNEYRRRGQGRKLSYPPSIDQELVQWILELKNKQLPVSSDMVKQKATTLITPLVATFKASSGWCEKFYRYMYVCVCVCMRVIGFPIFLCRRNALALKNSAVQKVTEDLEAEIAGYYATLKALHRRTDIPSRYFECVAFSILALCAAQSITAVWEI